MWRTQTLCSVCISMPLQRGWVKRNEKGVYSLILICSQSVACGESTSWQSIFVMEMAHPLRRAEKHNRPVWRTECLQTRRTREGGSRRDLTENCSLFHVVCGFRHVSVPATPATIALWLFDSSNRVIGSPPFTAAAVYSVSTWGGCERGHPWTSEALLLHFCGLWKS